jgi:hypothetical protein
MMSRRVGDLSQRTSRTICRHAGLPSVDYAGLDYALREHIGDRDDC